MATMHREKLRSRERVEASRVFQRYSWEASTRSLLLFSFLPLFLQPMPPGTTPTGSTERSSPSTTLSLGATQSNFPVLVSLTSDSGPAAFRKVCKDTWA